jgi:membrane protease YdiL (CAAX protease family)
VQYTRFRLKAELGKLLSLVKELDRKVITIFLTVAVLQTISYYYLSRRFFRANLFQQYQHNPDVFLIEYYYWFFGDFLIYFILPLFIIKFYFKEKFSDYGLSAGDYKTGIKITALFLLIMLPLVWIVSTLPEFNKTYPHLPAARDSWTTFFIFESGMLIYMISWEFIWRGYMLFGLKEKFGYYAVLIQMIPFLILHNGKPAPETFGAIIAGIALGILALRTNSIFYCVITHISVMFSIDFISTLRYRVKDYGIGLDSIINVIGGLK